MRLFSAGGLKTSAKAVPPPVIKRDPRLRTRIRIKIQQDKINSHSYMRAPPQECKWAHSLARPGCRFGENEREESHIEYTRTSNVRGKQSSIRSTRQRRIRIARCAEFNSQLRLSRGKHDRARINILTKKNKFTWIRARNDSCTPKKGHYGARLRIRIRIRIRIHWYLIHMARLHAETQMYSTVDSIASFVRQVF